MNQGAWVPGSSKYQYGYQSIPNIPITGAPKDANLARFGMLHDGSAYRLYCFKGSTNNELYQFAWNGSSYAYGHNSIPVLTLTKAPADADASSFAMLHSGSNYHCYLRRLGDPTKLYQFIYMPGTTTYEWGPGNWIPTLDVSGFPPDADWGRWAMLHDGSAYRLYSMQYGSNNLLYQGSWNGSTYQYGHNSIPKLELVNYPGNSLYGRPAMLHDGRNYRFYFQAP